MSWWKEVPTSQGRECVSGAFLCINDAWAAHISRWTLRWMDFRAIRFVWIGIVIRSECIYSHACATLIPYVKWLSPRLEFRKCTRSERANPSIRSRFLKIIWSSTTFYHPRPTPPRPRWLSLLSSRLRDPSQLNVQWTRKIGCSFRYPLTQLFVHAGRTHAIKKSNLLLLHIYRICLANYIFI